MRSTASVALLSLASTALAFGSGHDIKRAHKMRRVPASLKGRSDSVVAYYGYQNNIRGACGWLSADSDFVIGLSETYVTSEYTDNCGRQVVVALADDPSKTVTLTVTDSCKNCDAYISTAAFESLAGSLEGGMLNVTWSFVDDDSNAGGDAPAPTGDGSSTDAPSSPETSTSEVVEPSPSEDAPDAPSTTPASTPTPVSPGGSANGWTNVEYLTGDALFDAFNFDTGPSDNNGAANYVGRDAGLTYTDGEGNAVIAIDTTEYASLRNSVRMVSQAAYNVGTLNIINVARMPAVCGGWAAFWFNGGGPWPEFGEIDIIEGVNLFTQNIVSVHTGNSCSLVESAIDRLSAAVLKVTNTLSCSAYNDPAACGFNFDSKVSFGVPFNNNGGGTWATLIVNEGISFYFWPEGSVPGDVVANQPNPPNWGPALVTIPSTNCDIASNFKDLHMVLNINLGGTFGEGVWSQTGNGQDQSCAEQTGFGSAYEYISQKGSAFKDESWVIRSISTFKAE